MDVSHPINDPALPSYHRPELQALLPSLEVALDCYLLLNTNGRGSEKAKYLPREPGEPNEAYKSRLNRTSYTPIYRDALRAYSGLLSRFKLIDAPSSMQRAEQDIDRRGSSVYAFMSKADELTLRDGGCFIITDMPPGSGTNYLDEQSDGRDPYLILVERKDVVNWSTEFVKGREVVRHATVRQLVAVPDPNGYGCIIEPVYRVMKPGTLETFRVEKQDSKWRAVSQGVIETSLPVVPITWYGSSDSRFGSSDLPMNALAEMSLDHYRMKSALVELLHRCSLPIVVRKGAPMGVNGRPAPLLLGPNTGVDLPTDGSLEVVETSGKSLERHQHELQHLEELMMNSSLQFLYGSSVKTATEAALRSSQVSSQVAGMIRNKASTLSTIMKLWAAWSGELASLTSESGIAMNNSLITKPLEASEIAQLVGLYNAKILSKQTVLDELQRGGAIDPDLSVESELERIKEEAAVEQADQIDSFEPVTIDPLATE